MSLQIQIGADIGNVEKAIAQVGNSLNNIKQPAANAQAALFSVTQVARDLPFGFIAIQNNLPLVIDSFTSLTKASGGVGGAFKSLAASLAGPAGISFAFSAAIAGVTALTQKYGSLGNAVKALFGVNVQLTDSQKAFNEQIAKTTAQLTTEQSKVDILTKTLLNNKKPQSDRIAAYQELKKVAPDVVAGIKEENALTTASNLLIQQQASGRKDLIRLKIQEAGINAAISTSAEKLAVADRELSDAQAQQVRAYSALQSAQKNTLVQGPALTALIQGAFREYQNASNSVKTLESETAKLRKEQSQYLAQLDPIVNSIANSNKATNDRIKALKEEEKTVKKTASENIKNRKQELSELEKYNQKIFQLQSRLSYSLKESPIKVTEENIKKYGKASKDIQALITDNANLKGVGPKELIPGPSVVEANNKIKEIVANFQAGKQALETTFFNPLTDLFSNFFQTGKFAFKEFGKAVMSAIAQLVSKIIATGIITLLANIILPGSGTALNAMGKTGGGFGKAFGSAFQSVLGFGQVAAPSFANVGPGGMDMTGAVNLTLRGSDLVGAINRTNTTISRVG